MVTDTAQADAEVVQGLGEVQGMRGGFIGGIDGLPGVFAMRDGQRTSCNVPCQWAAIMRMASHVARNSVK
jgi:predicted regulator of Ras-like GTPase activity (Roadblock/LC7/MglB family)